LIWHSNTMLVGLEGLNIRCPASSIIPPMLRSFTTVHIKLLLALLKINTIRFGTEPLKTLIVFA